MTILNLTSIYEVENIDANDDEELKSCGFVYHTSVIILAYEGVCFLVKCDYISLWGCVFPCMVVYKTKECKHNIDKAGYFQQQSCTGDLVPHQSHQTNKMEQDHIVVWRISESTPLQFSVRLITVSWTEFHLAQWKKPKESQGMSACSHNSA